jgi:hypothetical protein
MLYGITIHTYSSGENAACQEAMEQVNEILTYYEIDRNAFVAMQTQAQSVNFEALGFEYTITLMLDLSPNRISGIENGNHQKPTISYYCDNCGHGHPEDAPCLIVNDGVDEWQQLPY